MPEIESTVNTVDTSVPKAAEHELVVVESFLGYAKGEVISEADKVRDLLESEWSVHVVKRIKAA